MVAADEAVCTKFCDAGKDLGCGDQAGCVAGCVQSISVACPTETRAIIKCVGDLGPTALTCDVPLQRTVIRQDVCESEQAAFKNCVL